MTPREWWLLYDANVGERRYGSLTESDCESLLHTLNEAMAKNG